jgi:D-alanyl-D-alanine carboxypeptidase
MRKKTGWRRLLTGCGWSTALLVLLIAVLLAWNWQQVRVLPPLFADILAEPEYATGLNAPDDVLAYLQARPDSFSLVVYSVAADGTAVDDEYQLWHNPDQPMPLASTKKILVLAAYAQAVATNQLDPNTAVSLAEWDRYHLPGTNGGAHIAVLTDLGLAVDDAGYALDPSATVTLSQMVHAMIRFSDNAAPDYLLDLLGEEAMAEVMVDAGMTPRPLLPHAGMVLTWQNHTQRSLTADMVAELTALPAAEYAARVWQMQESFLHSEWGEAERTWRRNDRRPPNPHRLEMAAANQLDNVGTAREFAAIMAGVASGTFISPDVSAIMRRYLEWPMAFSGNQEAFLALGSKGGSLAGLLTGATYYVPRDGAFEQQPRVVVLFMRDIPFAAWLRLSETFAQQQFEREMATNPGFVRQVTAVLPSE